MSVPRMLALSAFALLTPLGAAACSSEGTGYKSECEVSGCTVTFTRGVNAKASVLGIDAELVAVKGNTVTLKVGGQQVDIPVGQSQPANGLNATVQEVTDDKVVIKFATGVN
ncbi:hypothetical protein OG874_28990 [Nocardia sp. NBC_00565]|uniref:hypothetical protein n=1 Tax=Nocardia sp. NBC_00565 TaxID=2975993 RepID=UPI002E7FEFD7|nr:hypothetical protein [Nocardia sp. NBC_00565]WUC00860.1 hypothetical protein OG874_28990 [Nocardia sp. NBC_00565]